MTGAAFRKEIREWCAAPADEQERLLQESAAVISV